MSDYIPQTRVVKADYIHSNALVRAGFSNTTESLGAEFDRWLEQHDAEVAEAERERINGIIEQFIENTDYPEVEDSLQWLQDVIKGENK